MSQAKILDGKQLAAQIRQQIKQKTDARREKNLRPPGLAVILVGSHPASQIYVRNKRVACEEVGFHTLSYDLPENTSEAALCELIEQLNHDPAIDGILVQSPLPSHINEYHIIDTIRPDKDVDGFHPDTLGRLVQRRPVLRPCTAWGVVTLLEHYHLANKGLVATVVGASNNVGRPLALELLLMGATVTMCHRFTKDLITPIRQADLLVVAIGKPQVIQSEWIKPGAIVIDVGMNRRADGTLQGDIDFESAKHIAGWITPVPGGVGPMTIAILLQNTLLAAEQLH